MSEAAEVWLEFADRDLQAAQVLSQNSDLWEAACFHFHQAAEKALKAVLLAGGKRAPRIHNLVVLAREAAAVAPDLNAQAQPAARLNPFYLQTRYPVDVEHRVERHQVQEASEAAGSIVAAAHRAVQVARGKDRAHQ